jgi:hypothetical protein
MVGVAFVLGFISWHAARRPPSLLSWFTAAVAAIGMFKMAEVAWFPEKPSEASMVRMQEEFQNATTDSRSEEIWWSSLSVVGKPVPKSLRLHEYRKNLRSFWLHSRGVYIAQVMILLTLAGAGCLWRDFAVSEGHWLRLHWGFLLWGLMGILGSWLFPSFSGLYQRAVYVGAYFWMRLVVETIERERRIQNAVVD